MFGSTEGFSGSADRMALLPVWPNSIGMWEKAMHEELIRSQSKVFLVQLQTVDENVSFIFGLHAGLCYLNLSTDVPIH